MVSHSTIYAVGNVSRQLVGFLMLPIYTNYLSPSDYGVIGLLVFLVSLFEILLGGHMFQAIPKFYHEQDNIQQKNSVINTAFLVTSVFSGSACLVMAGFSTPLSNIVFGNADYSIYVTIFSALILTHALEQYSLTYIRIIKKPWTFFNFNMAKLALQLSLNVITIVVLEWGLMGLALSSLVSSVTIALILMFYTLYHTGIHTNKFLAIKILKFSWPLWLSGMIGLYIGSSNRYFIRIFSSLDEVGLFELAAKFGAIVGVLVWSPFAQYWQTERYSIAKNDNPYPAYSLAFRMITALLLISGVWVSAFSPILIELMSAPEFHSAINAVPFLILASVFQCLTIFNNFSFLITNKTLELTKNNIFTAAIITFFYATLIPKFGFVGAAAGLALGSLAQYCYALHTGKKFYPLRINQTGLITACLVFSSYAAIDYIFIPQNICGLTIFAKTVSASILSFVIAIILFRKEELLESKCYLTAFMKRH
nr:oligosaccharide flippase family protein [Marinobacter sediminum]